MTISYNVAVVGQTGVGKSSLINYLYGGDVVKSGVGRPVTQNGFHPLEMEINGLPVTIFDSWGLEVDRHEEWMAELNQELKRRDVSESADKWFHSVFYCIQAGGARFQHCDERIIKKFIENNYNVSVVLTKSDYISENEEFQLKMSIRDVFGDIYIIPVCSERKVTRSGVSEPFGKEDIERKAYSDFFDSMILRLPLRCEKLMRDMRDAWLLDSRSYIGRVGMAGFYESDVREDLDKRFAQLSSDLSSVVDREVKETFRMFSEFAWRLGYSLPSLTDFDSLKSEFYKESPDLKWWDVPLMIVASPLVVFWAVAVARSDAERNLNSDINSSLLSVDKYIDSYVNQIRTSLRSVKNKAIPLLEYQ